MPISPRSAPDVRKRGTWGAKKGQKCARRPPFPGRGAHFGMSRQDGRLEDPLVAADEAGEVVVYADVVKRIHRLRFHRVVVDDLVGLGIKNDYRGVESISIGDGNYGAQRKDGNGYAPDNCPGIILLVTGESPADHGHCIPVARRLYDILDGLGNGH